MTRRRYKIDSRLVLVETALVLSAILSATSVPTTFHFDGVTERLHIALDTRTVSWSFESAQLFLDHSPQPTSFSRVFRPAANSDVVIERVAFGPVRIRVQNNSGIGHLIRVDLTEDPEGQTFIASRRAVFVVADITRLAESGLTLTLPFSGKVSVGTGGAIATDATTPLVRTGRVTMIGRSLLSDLRYEAGSVELAQGDSFEVPDAQGSATGIVSADDRVALTAAFGIPGTSAVVRRFGAEGFRIRVTLPARISGDLALQAFWLIYVAISGVIVWLTK